MTSQEIREGLFRMQDIGYRDFQAKLIPGIEPEQMIGVRTPQLRSFAKELVRQGGTEEFLAELPHPYFDENQLHAFIISLTKDYGTCIRQVDAFLPYVDNWATCDQLSPKVFRKNRQALLESIEGWMQSEQTYTVRFGIGMLMEHFLDEDFDPAYLRQVASVRSEEYYINMMVAWYFATALAKQWEQTVPFIEKQRLDDWTHNKTIQKAIESRRITPEQKDYLRGLKVARRR